MPLLNGTRELTEEQFSEAQRLRSEFRDGVSRRMGELLLQGMTMLDAYCQVCNGILMEDRNGVRNCVTCELFEERTKEGSRLVAEVPLVLFKIMYIYISAKYLKLFCMIHDKKHVLCNNGTSLKVRTIEKKQKIREPVQKFDVQPSNSSTYNRSAPVVDHSSSNLLVHTLDGYATALLAVDRKLKWASDCLDRSESLAEIRELFALINEGISIVKCMGPRQN
ncbi:Sjogren'S syndrome/scleroderma autoantigen 1 [Dictyocaulus viviparus]|uniref:Sjogren'S syndrome/scleroderma autoantigen 1 n=1 Tax=Dictyocaulus viviparus TaxID=29172 RepID=A0A0D8Y2A2_DICVI|nr:Sjogren'S syndrome/scleroderma autoantigen 1 [Dictyocaulus viviparus]